MHTHSRHAPSSYGPTRAASPSAGRSPGYLGWLVLVLLPLLGCSSLLDGTTDPEAALGDTDHDGWAVCPSGSELSAVRCDCNDWDPGVNPDAGERCDLLDTNCDGVVPDNETRDVDGDSFVACLDCPEQEGDADSTVNPGATELCNGRDDNCDGVVKVALSEPDGIQTLLPETDTDGDGFRICDGDCDDGNATVYPGSVERCVNSAIDNNCDGIADDSDADDALTFYLDSDDDGFGVSSSPRRACSLPEGFAGEGGDCDDQQPYIHPGAYELCDEIDQDCNGDPRNYLDGDGDGYGLSSDAPCQNVSGWVGRSGDCDDADPSVYPGAPEDPEGTGLGDEKDNDCDGGLDEGTSGYDGDRDGWTLFEGDCDDTSSYVHPEAAELCDARDNDCDGLAEDQTPESGCVWLVAPLASCTSEASGEASGPPCDGRTWQTAFRHPADLEEHLLKPLDEVWIARGTYRARPGATEVLALLPGVIYRGGFVGNETLARQRSVPLSGTAIDGGPDMTEDSGEAGDTTRAATAKLAGEAGSPPRRPRHAALPSDRFDDASALAAHGPLPRKSSRHATISDVSTSVPSGVSPIVVGADGAVLEGLSIQNGYRPDLASGAGLVMPDAGSLTVRDCLFQNNATLGVGGGLAMLGGGSLTLERTTFRDNVAQAGGGLYLLGVSLEAIDVVFDGNSATGGGGGLRLDLRDPDATLFVRIQRSSFLENRADQSAGGAIQSASFLTLLDTSFVNNLAAIGGGGVSAPSVRIEQSTFYENQAPAGSALELTATTTTTTSNIYTSVFFGNAASDGAEAKAISAPYGAPIYYRSSGIDEEVSTTGLFTLAEDPIDHFSARGAERLQRGEPYLRPNTLESDTATGYVNPCVRLPTRSTFYIWPTSTVLSDGTPDLGYSDLGRRYFPDLLYVDPAVETAYPDGRTLETAFRSINEALLFRPADRLILLRLSGGTFRPSAAGSPVVSLPSDVWLEGNGHATVLDGDFDRDGGWSSGDSPHVVEMNEGNVLISLAVAGGDGELGGGVYAPHPATLHGVQVSRCRARMGGGIYFGSSGTVVDSAFFENVATEDGGALFGADPSEQLLLLLLSLDSNQADRGGALFTHASASVALYSAMFNTARLGGFLYGASDSDSPLLSLSVAGTIGRSRAEEGGALYCVFCDVVLESFNIFDSRAGRGGAVAASFGSLRLLDGTITQSEADLEGGAIWGDRLSPLELDNVALDGCGAADGGGIFLVNQSELQIDSSRFQDSSADRGGAISVAYVWPFELERAHFLGNHADDGGAIYGQSSEISVMETTLESNEAYAGGAISAYSSSLVLADSALSYNYATEGGAIRLSNDARDEAVEHWIHQATFSGNVADEGGALLSLGGDLVVRDSTFASNSGAVGGSLELIGGSLDMANSTLLGNQAEEGGAIWSRGAELVLTNLTVAFNSAESDAGAIWAALSPHGADPGSLELRNSILWENQAGTQDGLVLDAPELARIDHTASDELLEGENNIGLSISPFDVFAVDGQIPWLFLIQDDDNPCLNSGVPPEPDAFPWTIPWYQQTTARDGTADQTPIDLGRHTLPDDIPTATPPGG